MDVVYYIIALLLTTAIMAGFLWIAMRLIRVNGHFVALLLASFISMLISMIPLAGDLLSLICLLLLLYQWTDMDNWLYGLLIVFLARLLAAFCLVGIAGLTATL